MRSCFLRRHAVNEHKKWNRMLCSDLLLDHPLHQPMTGRPPCFSPSSFAATRCFFRVRCIHFPLVLVGTQLCCHAAVFGNYALKGGIWQQPAAISCEDEQTPTGNRIDTSSDTAISSTMLMITVKAFEILYADRTNSSGLRLA